jgi:hypothetical protein
MSTEDVREAIGLFDQSKLIPQVRIIPTDKDRFVIEMIFNIKNR